MNGLDPSIVVYALDPTTEEHGKPKDSILSIQRWAVNATVVHEVYHTLVFKRGFSSADSRLKLGTLVRDSRTAFPNPTKAISLYSMELASEFDVGGRDSLILGCYLKGGIERVLTHDRELLRIGKLEYRGRGVILADPLAA